MTKNNDPRLVPFPTPQQAEDALRADLAGDETLTPEWRQEVSRRVQEHLRLKELRTGMGRITAAQGISGLPVSEHDRQDIESRFASHRVQATPEHLSVDNPPVTENDAPIPSEHLKFASPIEQVASEAPKQTENENSCGNGNVPGEADHSDPSGGTGSWASSTGEWESSLKAHLEEAHHLLFKDEDTEPIEAPVSMEPGTPLHTNTPEIGPNETPATPFDDVPLTKKVALDPFDSQPAGDDILEDGIRRDDYDKPVGELLNRHQRYEDSGLLFSQIAPRHSRSNPAVRCDRTILISRFLSGLIDLLIVFLASLSLVVTRAVFTQTELLSAGMGWMLLIVFALVQIEYGFYFCYVQRRTIGMMLVGLEVHPLDDSGRISFITAFTRTLFHLISLLLGGIGLLWGVFDPQARCLHDILSNSIVQRNS